MEADGIKIHDGRLRDKFQGATQRRHTAHTVVHGDTQKLKDTSNNTQLIIQLKDKRRFYLEMFNIL